MTNKYKFLFLLLVPSFSMGQSNYKPGYAVNLKGDTLRGFIDYKEWDKNPDVINFKSELNSSKSEVFSTQNTSAFTISGLEYYQRFVVSVSQDQVDINKLAQKLDTAKSIDTVFLHLNAKGSHVSLYSYTDDIKPRFFVLEAGETQPKELTYSAWYNTEVSSSVQYVNRYRTQLEYLSQKYGVTNSALSARIAQAGYTGPELTKIAQAINGSSSQQFTPASLVGSRWFIGAGVSYSNLKFTETGGTGFGGKSVTNSSSIFPKIAAGIDFFTNKSVQSLLIRVEYSFTVNQYKVSNVNMGTPQSTTTINFTQYNNSLTPQIVYNVYNKDQVKLFIGAGAALNFSAYNHYQDITSYGGSFPEVVKNGYPAFSQFWISFPIKAGIAFNKNFEISVCYIPSSSLTTDDISSANVTSFQVGINYLFGAK